MRTMLLPCLAASLSLGAVALAQAPPTTTATPRSSLSVVYNHEGDEPGDLLPRGGFAAVVRLGDRTLLLDAGGEAGVIAENLARVGVAPSDLEALIVSHNHWDHVYGLPGVMGGMGDRPPVFVVASAAAGIRQQFPRAEVVAVAEAIEILPQAWLTGPMPTTFREDDLDEQALVVETPSGLVVVTGCSHPGILAIVRRAAEMLPDTPIALVAGGFHLRSTGPTELEAIADGLEALGVRRIAPSHCTGAEATQMFRQRWGERFVRLGLGDTVSF